MRFISNEQIDEATKIRDDVEFNIINHDENFSYIVSTPIFENFEKFIELSQLYPFFSPNGHQSFNFFLKQYFSRQHTKTICDMIENQLTRYFGDSKYDFSLHDDFSNIYYNLNNFQCPLDSCFPHIDSTNNTKIAVNFWFSTNENDATSFWKIKDSCFYNHKNNDYLIKTIKKYAKEHDISRDCTDFFNLVDYMDIKKVIDIPSLPNTLTMYFGDIWHSPKIDMDGENLRWSYVFFYDILDKK